MYSGFFPEKHNVALVSAILMAGWPQFLFMSRAISNDILTAVLSLAVLTTLIALGNPNRYIWAALLTGLAVLTKSTALFIVAAVIGAYVIEIIVNRDPKYSGSPAWGWWNVPIPAYMKEKRAKYERDMQNEDV